MKQRLVLAMVVLTLGGCGMFGAGKKNMNEKQGNKETSGGLEIDIVEQ